MPKSRQTPRSATGPGWEQWWMAGEPPCNLLCFNIRLSRPSSSQDLRLHTFTFLCSFHNASISITSLASFNIVHYWNEHRKPITQVAGRVGPVPNQPHWEWDSLLRCTRTDTRATPPSGSWEWPLMQLQRTRQIGQASLCQCSRWEHRWPEFLRPVSRAAAKAVTLHRSPDLQSLLVSICFKKKKNRKQAGHSDS